jgi:hypothetical protein
MEVAASLIPLAKFFQIRVTLSRSFDLVLGCAVGLAPRLATQVLCSKMVINVIHPELSTNLR